MESRNKAQYTPSVQVRKNLMIGNHIQMLSDKAAETCCAAEARHFANAALTLGNLHTLGISFKGHKNLTEFQSTEDKVAAMTAVTNTPVKAQQ